MLIENLITIATNKAQQQKIMKSRKYYNAENFRPYAQLINYVQQFI